jgi:superfamily I DNA/RNA helicase
MDDADLEEVYDTERHLLYVACTRARDHLLLTGVEPLSEFVEDFAGWTGELAMGWASHSHTRSTIWMDRTTAHACGH